MIFLFIDSLQFQEKGEREFNNRMLLLMTWF